MLVLFDGPFFLFPTIVLIRLKEPQYRTFVPLYPML